MDILEQLKEYYKNLLIFQYQKPNAEAEIKLLASVLFPINSETDNLLLDDIQDAFAVETATGVNLDVVGDYVGLSRIFADITYSEGSYYGYTDYYTDGDVDSDVYGTSDYTDFDTLLIDTLVYAKINVTELLSDENFRSLIKLKIVTNHSNGSTKEIADALFSFFSAGVVFDESDKMSMLYWYDTEYIDLVDIALQKNLLPKPAGVEINGIIENIEGGFISMASYSTDISDIDDYRGYTEFTDFDTTDGGLLRYDNIESV